MYNTKITALKFNHIVYRKKRRGAGLDKLILLCPLKLLITFFVPQYLSFLLKKFKVKKQKNPTKSIRTSDYVTFVCLRNKCKEIYEPKEINADGFCCCGLETKP